MKKTHKHVPRMAVSSTKAEYPRRYAEGSREQVPRVLEAFTSKARVLRDVPADPFFAARVMARHKERKTVTFWGIFENMPGVLVQAAYVMSILIMIFILYSHRDSSLAGMVQIQESYLFQSPWPDEALTSQDQALQFALSSEN